VAALHQGAFAQFRRCRNLRLPIGTFDQGYRARRQANDVCRKEIETMLQSLFVRRANYGGKRAKAYAQIASFQSKNRASYLYTETNTNIKSRLKI